MYFTHKIRLNFPIIIKLQIYNKSVCLLLYNKVKFVNRHFCIYFFYMSQVFHASDFSRNQPEWQE